MSVFLIFIKWCLYSWIFCKFSKEPQCSSLLIISSFSTTSSWNDQPWHSASFQLMVVSWSCVPALTWVWFIIQFKPWIDQRPGEMEGTSTTGAFLCLVTVKRKGDMSKHFSSPLSQHHQRCTASLLHHTALPPDTGKTPVTPLLMSRLFLSLMIYSLALFFFFSAAVQICAGHIKTLCLHVKPLFCCTTWTLLGLDRYVGWY